MKKNLIILLLIPFLIALVGIVAVDTTFNLIATDILYIDWDYDDVETFKVSEERYELKAIGVSESKYPPSNGNQLIWTVRNKDDSTEDLAHIVTESNKTYLEPLKPGEVIITCSNQKQTVFRSMTGLIYENGIIAISPKNPSSQKNIDQNAYFGEYDFNENMLKRKANIELKIEVQPAEFKDQVMVKDVSSNIDFDLANEKVTVKEAGEAYIKLGYLDTSIAKDTTYNFKIVENGMNVYTYDELLACTNKSQDGEIVVLRKSFESFENTYETLDGEAVYQNGKLIKKQKNVELFGTYLGEKNKYDFRNEVVYLPTTYNKEFIKQWNSFVDSNSNYQKLDEQIAVGLYVKKDFYGNGYTLNLHNLTYPYSFKKIKDKATGKDVYVPSLNDDNLFKGPLHYYTLGNANDTPLVTAFGQDNVGMYVEGNNIVINDIELKNCDFGNSLENLDLVGTTLELAGQNITVKNSRISNGKNVLRSFSSSTTIDNCMLSNSRNFLISTGSNRFVKVEGDKVCEFNMHDGTTMNSKIKDFLDKNSAGDLLLAQYLGGSFEDINKMREVLLGIQNALNAEEVAGMYDGEMTINDSIFYQSGISSIALESLFNGPYLYSSSPSAIDEIFRIVGNGKELLPLKPTEVGGTSYPVKVNLTGKTTFYDYKDVNALDISGLISENISDVVNGTGFVNIRDIDIDDIFPIKKLLVKQAREKGCVYHGSKDGTVGDYINIPIAYYGGGLNFSTVSYADLDCKNELSEDFIIDFLNEYLNLEASSDFMQNMKQIILKAVTVVTGVEPFKFVCIKGNGYKFNEKPTYMILVENAKGV